MTQKSLIVVYLLVCFGQPSARSQPVLVGGQKQLLADDPTTQSNLRGRVSFARSGPNSRTTQVFVNYKDNSSLDDRFAPFGEVVEGMDVVGRLYAEYGDGPPRGEGVYQAMAIARGGEYFDEEFPELDRIERASVVEAG